MSTPRTTINVFTIRDLDPDEQYDRPVGRWVVRIQRLEVCSFQVHYTGRRVRADGTLGAAEGDYLRFTGDDAEDTLRVAVHMPIMAETIEAWRLADAAVRSLSDA